MLRYAEDVQTVLIPMWSTSHCAPETQGSINEGGELGYSVAHAFGAVFDNGFDCSSI